MSVTPTVPSAALPDPLTPEQRSYCMSRIRGTDTRPELILRRGLHALGFRFRLHDRKLPGTPDLILPKHHAVIWVHGCFWHGHDCPLFRLPATRTEFWSAKIAANQQRDARALTAAQDTGWRTLVLWECALRGRGKLPLDEMLAQARGWLLGSEPSGKIEGYWRAERDQSGF